VRVLVTDQSALTAMGVASHFRDWNRATEVAVMTGEDWHPGAYTRRDTIQSANIWHSCENIQMFDEPKEVLEYKPELIINTDPQLGFVMESLVAKLDNPFHFGCQKMSTILSQESKMGLNLIRRAGLDVVEHHAFDSLHNFLGWVVTQEDPTEDLIVEADNQKEYFIPAGTNFFSIAHQMHGKQFLVRKYSNSLCEFGIIFSGNGFIGRPFLVKEQEPATHILHFGDQSEEFTNRILNKLSTVLEAIGFRGPLFLSFDTITQKINRISSRPPKNFWLTFLSGLNQSVGKYLFSLSKGVKFSPEVRQAVYGYHYTQNEDMQAAWDETTRACVPDAVKDYWAGIGDQTFYVRWEGGFPGGCVPAGLLCSSQSLDGFISHSRIPSALRTIPPFIVPNLPLLMGLFHNQAPSPELPETVEYQEQEPESETAPVEETNQEEEVTANGVSR